jgi:hypothetical protein
MLLSSTSLMGVNKLTCVCCEPVGHFESKEGLGEVCTSLRHGWAHASLGRGKYLRPSITWIVSIIQFACKYGHCSSFNPSINVLTSVTSGESLRIMWLSCGLKLASSGLLHEAHNLQSYYVIIFTSSDNLLHLFSDANVFHWKALEWYLPHKEHSWKGRMWVCYNLYVPRNAQ